MTTTDGISLNSERIIQGDTTGPASARTILGDPLVEAAVLETARGGILRRGLGYDWSDISVITNISEDHIGQDGIESIADLINIKSLIAERVRTGGTLILNADDKNSLTVVKREKVKYRRKKIVYFSLDENNPVLLKHLEKGGTVYFVKGNWVVEAAHGINLKIIKINSIPITMNGAAEFQIENVLATVAACRAFGLSTKSIASLQTFQNEINNPGRSNFYQVGKGYVLVDYGHNTGAFQAICRMAACWKGKKVTGIIGVPGDRDNRIIEDAGRTAAHGFERIIIKEDQDTRGRENGEVARLLCEVIKSEKPDLSCEIVLDEIEAFSRTIRDLKKNEVVVIFYDRLEPILEILQQNQAVAVTSFEETIAPQQEKEYVHSN
jgi:cyanophycin synthetase